ncbi:MAG: flagellar motor protein MotB [Armatimonadota bacterium]|nr:flagellar motor protein MotB [Armatimonadota bacterium]MDR7439029.1 flagellar motor protein MotB [Armatimonadota bacterium]MDR7563597.1 flagellar motor protein MotB [Armatimonadota bacterium]MDR7566845.1 flagellar motor protein MotB [Armatimonadota bacterium]MDR7601202.1 flagellar motor protein MotB [Armatimonadota bacterium]
MRRRRNGAQAGGGHGGGGLERWLVTYADLITLLLAYFIMVYSLSQLDLAKFKKVLAGFRAATTSLGMLEGSHGVLPGGSGVLELDVPSPTPAADPIAESFRSLASGILQQITAAGLGAQVEVRVTSEGVRVSMAGPLLFDTASADLRPEAEPVLRAVARAIRARSELQVRVEGHADARPIHTYRFPSNWELSSARAGAVVRRLMHLSGADGTRFTIVGYGDSRPVRRGTDPVDLARNRRVEILLLRP